MDIAENLVSPPIRAFDIMRIVRCHERDSKLFSGQYKSFVYLILLLNMTLVLLKKP